MRPLVVVLALVVFGSSLLGCDSKAQSEVGSHSQAAGEHLRQAAMIAGESARKRLQSVSDRTSPAARTGALNTAKEAEKALASLKEKTPEVEKKLAELRQRIAELMAGSNDDLESTVEPKVAPAKPKPKKK